MNDKEYFPVSREEFVAAFLRGLRGVRRPEAGVAEAAAAAGIPVPLVRHSEGAIHVPGGLTNAVFEDGVPVPVGADARQALDSANMLGMQAAQTLGQLAQDGGGRFDYAEPTHEQVGWLRLNPDDRWFTADGVAVFRTPPDADGSVRMTWAFSRVREPVSVSSGLYLVAAEGGAEHVHEASLTGLLTALARMVESGQSRRDGCYDLSASPIGLSKLMALGDLRAMVAASGWRRHGGPLTLMGIRFPAEFPEVGP